MPISRDPDARKRQIAAIREYSFPRRREGHRSTRNVRLILPEDLADTFDGLPIGKRRELLEAASEELELEMREQGY